MRKILMSSAAPAVLFLATAAFSQNTSSVTQTGTGALATVTQSNANNDSFVTQGGTANKASVSQTEVDSGNNLPRYRDDDGDDVPAGAGDAVRANFSKITQSGARNETALTQRGDLNRTAVTQSGSDATITASQTGIFNNITARQSADADATVTQGGNYGDNNAILNQTANGAAVTVTQIADVTVPTFFPTNEARIQQDADATGTISQNGHQNYARLNQQVGAAGAEATIEQVNPGSTSAADLNIALVDQSAATTAFVRQDGQGNTSTLTQTGASDTYRGGRVYAATVFQLGTDGVSTITQGGTDNTVALLQTAGSERATSTITQSGTDNYSDVLQAGSDNGSVIQQSGSSNTTTVSQMSDHNSSNVMQSGSNNTVYVSQGM